MAFDSIFFYKNVLQENRPLTRMLTAIPKYDPTLNMPKKKGIQNQINIAKPAAIVTGSYHFISIFL